MSDVESATMCGKELTLVTRSGGLYHGLLSEYAEWRPPLPGRSDQGFSCSSLGFTTLRENWCSIFEGETYGQCCGSVTFWHWSGSCLFRQVFCSIFFAFYFLKVPFIYISLQRLSPKEAKCRRNQGFSYFFCLFMEGSGSVQIMTDPNPGGPKHTDPDPRNMRQRHLLSCSVHLIVLFIYLNSNGKLADYQRIRWKRFYGYLVRCSAWASARSRSRLASHSSGSSLHF